MWSIRYTFLFVSLTLTAVLAGCNRNNTTVAEPDTKPQLTINNQSPVTGVVLATHSSDKAISSTIEGGFGFVLGSFYSLSPEVKPKTGVFGLISIEVQPPSPNSTFSYYALRLTPKTNRIAEIQAHQFINSSDECQRSATAIQQTLEEKYGLSTPVPNEQTVFNSAIVQANLGIVISCYPMGGAYDLSVGYFDSDIRTQGKMEAADIASETQDTKGL